MSLFCPCLSFAVTDGGNTDMPLTVQEELTAEFTRQIEQMTAISDALKMEKESSLQAFDKYR